jgi:hypothetical protein
MISFSKDFSEARFSTAVPVQRASGTVDDPAVYMILKVIEARGTAMTMFAENEAKKTASGASVVWSLVLISDDRHYWRRTDWPANTVTPTMVRCKQTALVRRPQP